MEGSGAIVVALALYFLPAIVAASRKHHQGLAVFMLNLFLGWTLIGWVLSLVWACTATDRAAYEAKRIKTASAF